MLDPETIRHRIIEHRRMRLGDVLPNPRNWKDHPESQGEALDGILEEVGWLGSPIAYHSERMGGALTWADGNLRGARYPDLVDDVDIADLSDAEADLILLTYDPIAAMAHANAEKLDAVLRDAESSNAAVMALVAQVASEAGLYLEESKGVLGGDESGLSVAKDAKPNPRNLPIDVIYTLQMADCTCCLAVQAGLKYGIQSGSYRLCPYKDMLGERHKVAFIDNDYFKYDHAKHLAAVRELRPKYATVRDLMSKAQCQEAGIEYFDLRQVLDWAEELAQYAENVIVIPKYDCLDKIPDKFVLGYSVPTSHGGTPLQVSAFKGRRVHLLGGSWKAQLAHMAELGDDVVSVDNNQVELMASKWGQFVSPDGETQQVQTIAPAIRNVRYVALALSFGAMGAKINELYAGSATPAE